MMKRRDLVRALALGSGTLALGLPRIAFARIPSERRFVLVILRGGMDGLELLDMVKSLDPDLPVIMISGHGNIETAVSAIKRGAYEFLEKPFKSDRLLLIVERALEAAGLKRGAYHFFYWCRVASDQADWFIRNVPRDPDALPPVIDVEYNGESSCRFRLSPEKAREMAKASDARLAAGQGGALEGIPLGIKDMFCTAGVRTTAVSAIYADRVPAEDAVVVRRLRQAGAVADGLGCPRRGDAGRLWQRLPPRQPRTLAPARRRRSSRRPTTWPPPSPRCRRSRTAAGSS